jgi:hypothetical protein
MVFMTCRSRRLSAQSAFEFMFIFGIFLGALLVGTWVSLAKLSDMSSHQEKLHASRLLDTVSGKVDSVWLEGSGFSTNVTIPETIAGLNYTLDFSSNVVYIVVDEREYLRTVVTKNLTGSFTTGKTNTLSNRGGFIDISAS